MRIFPWMRLPLFEGEGGGAGGGAGDGGAGDGGQGDGGGGGWAAPDFIPEAFRGASAEETLEKLAGGYTEAEKRASGLRDKLASLPKAPKSADDYTFTPSEKLAPFFGENLADNPGLKAARAAMHKHGISQAQFEGLISDIYEPLIDAGQIAAPFDPRAEVSTFMKATGLDAKATAAALTEAADFAEGLAGQLKDVPPSLAEEVKATLIGLSDTAAGAVLLKALSGRLAENGIRLGGEGGAAGALTEDEIKALTGDPRVDPRNRNHPDAAKRFDETLYQKWSDGLVALDRKKREASAVR